MTELTFMPIPYRLPCRPELLRGFFVAAIFFSIAGCTSMTTNLGNHYYEQGHYDLAALNWNDAAKAGDPAAQYNLGLLWRDGLGSTPKNLHEAASWFVLSARQGFIPAMVEAAKVQRQIGYNDAADSWLQVAARYGNSEAQNMLAAGGKQVPYPDLLQQQIIAEQVQAQQTAEAAAALGQSLGCLAGGGCNQAPSNSYGRSTTGTFNSTLTTERQVISEKSCTSDFFCGIGYTCVKAPLKSAGVCMQSVDEFGTQQYNLPDNDSVLPNLDLEGQCNFDTDCSIGFRCDSEYKVCVK